MTAELFVVRIVSSTRSPSSGRYVGRVAWDDGEVRSWSPGPLPLAEFSESYQRAADVELACRGRGHSFEIVHLAEPENPDAGALLIENLSSAIHAHVGELDGIVRQWRSFEPGGGQHVGTRPNLTPTWIARFDRWADDLRGVVAPVLVDVDRALAGASLGLTTEPTWIQVAEQATKLVERANKLAADLACSTRDVQRGTLVIRRLAGAIRRHANVLEEGASTCRDNIRPRAEHPVDQATNRILDSVAQRYDHWVRELRDVVAGIPE